LGIDDKTSLSSFFILDCSFATFSISIEIALDFSKRDLSFSLEIFFFSFSRVSFS
jgi:hypothetical protein